MMQELFSKKILKLVANHSFAATVCRAVLGKTLACLLSFF